MNIATFNHDEFGTVEVLMVDDKPYFPATECAKILGYRNPQQAIRLHCKGVLKTSTPSNGGIQQSNYIPEGDLYRLIIRSKLPSAVRFESFVCDVILPSVRQYGAYITPDILNRMRDDSAFAESLLEALTQSEAKNSALLTYVGKLQPKAHYCDTILLNPNGFPISIIAKEFGMSAIAFNKLLHALGVQFQCRKTWLLHQKYANQGYTVTNTLFHGRIHTLWTHKGRAFIYDILERYGIVPKV